MADMSGMKRIVVVEDNSVFFINLYNLVLTKYVIFFLIWYIQ